jgi:hypothetical protein
MNYSLLTYALYLPATILITVWVARTLFNNGHAFLIEIFHGDETLANAVNKLLLVGFYLVNFGYALVTIKVQMMIIDLQSAVEVLCVKLGTIVLILGAMHFLNLYIFFTLRKRAKQQLAESIQ